MRPSLRQVLFRSATGLDLNFAGGVFSLNNTRTDTPAAIPGWSFSRTDTNGTATALDLAGNVIQFPSRTNLLLQSQTFDNASWTKTAGLSVTADATVAPDGTNTADKIFENTTASTAHVLFQSGGSVTGAHTITIFAKAAERSWLRVSSDDGGGKIAWFNLADGTVGTVQAGLSNAAIVASANGFYRCSVTITNKVSGGNIAFGPATADAASDTYAGTVGSGIFLWGAQLELGSTATAYIPTTTAAVTVVLPRITNRGILVEEARTNGVRNSAAAGAVVGTPGTAPTNWQIGLSTGLSRQIVATGSTAQGIPYVDLRMFGTTTTGAGSTIKFEGNQVIAASNSQTWSAAISCALIAGSSGGTNVAAAFDVLDSSGAFLAIAQGSAATVGAVNRPSHTATIANASAAFVQPYLLFAHSGAGQAVDLTIRISLPQMELGAFATSPIITTGAAGTRGAEQPNQSLVFPAEGTILLDYEGPPVGNAARGYGWSVDDSGNDRLALRVCDFGANTPTAVVGDGTANSNLTTSTATTSGQIARIGLAYSTLVARAGFAQNGVLNTVARQMAASGLAGNLLGIAQNQGGGNHANTYIRRIRILPFAATDAQLQALTAP